MSARFRFGETVTPVRGFPWYIGVRATVIGFSHVSEIGVPMWRVRFPNRDRVVREDFLRSMDQSVPS